MEQSITFRELDKHEIGMAMELAWEVFMQFEAPEYSDEGINEFYRSIHDDDSEFLERFPETNSSE